jgi:hypothetical protein
MAQSSPEKAALKRCVFRRDLKERRLVQVISPIGINKQNKLLKNKQNKLGY